MAELFADRLADEWDLVIAEEELLTKLPDFDFFNIRELFFQRLPLVTLQAKITEAIDFSELVRRSEGHGGCDILRHIFGNPFRPISLNPSWLTSTVLALAQGIYSEKAFDRMPILANTLQDAGCDNADILDHCRQPGVHTRGCWCVDLLLGKS